MNRFAEQLTAHGLDLRRAALETLQLNLGRKCNQACRHCHVDAAPWRTEMMSPEVAERIFTWIRTHRPSVIDITGGAPELNSNFRTFVELAAEMNLHCIERNNLTILEEPGFEDLHTFLAEHQVEIIASLPCYLEKNVNQQRGNGAFLKSIRGLKKLNSVGFGTALPLHLVYNPLGPQLPPPQSELEADYKEALARDHGIVFNRLLTITNQPIARFEEDLRETGRLAGYMNFLCDNFNPATVPGLMCRTTLSVGYNGEIYDCDFNQMLGMQLRAGRPLFLWDVTPGELTERTILTADHCLACTAGCGSSCGGALAA
ncbi:MAG: arsenosugar biosynthesis radical SAM (seleno)protein ArsS [Limisphaerales bacterium]